MLSKLVLISRWAKISLLTGFVLVASVGAGDTKYDPWNYSKDYMEYLHELEANSSTSFDQWKFQRKNVGSFSASSCDSTRIDTTWGELDSVRANMCMAYSGLYNHVLVARRGFTCGLGTADQQWDHTCGCDCRWYDIWRKIEQIDTVKRLQGKYSFSYVDNGWSRDSVEALIMLAVEEFRGLASSFHHDTLDPPHDTAREYMRVDTVIVRFHLSRPLGETKCDSVFCIDTTWHPKVQFTVDTVECCLGLGTHLVRFRNLPGWECWCIPENPLIIAQPCTIRFDTTWLPIPVSIWIKDSTVDILE